MSQTIHRMFHSHEHANAAATELRNHRLDRFDDVHVFTSRGPTGAELSADDIVAAMMKGHVLKAHAKVLAQGVKRGSTLVTVHAPFGTAASAIDVLERHGAGPSGLPEVKEQLRAWDDAAPLSSALSQRVLLDDSATFSRFWNVAPLLKSGATTSSALGMPEISRSSGPYSGAFPLPLLSRKATPLSSMLSLPVLSKGRAAKR